MDNISNQIRAKLKRLCPYVGSYIPNSVRQDARKYWQPLYDAGKEPGWFWDDGGDFFQCVLPICDLDAKTIDPAGYVAIRPLEGDQYALVFVLGPTLLGASTQAISFSIPCRRLNITSTCCSQQMLLKSPTHETS
jgi:hypothetical protein